MGPFPDVVYENDELPFEKGDRLILFTDGIVESQSKTGELFGEERLEGLVKALSDESPNASADRIVEQVISWSHRSAEQSLDDDLTLIVADMLNGPSLRIVTAD